MKAVCFSVLFLCLGLAGAEPEPAIQGSVASAWTWTADYEEALAIAQRENRLVLLNFTGSDWCGWCFRLRDEVFVQNPFLAYAKESLVLVEVDFPRKKVLSPALAQQNDELGKQFSVNGYPTIILVDPEGKELGRTGYMQGGAKTFVRELKRFASKAVKKAD